MIFVFLLLISLSVIPSRPLHFVANGKISFFFTAEQYSIVIMYHIFLIQSSADGHRGCSRILAIVNNDAVDEGCTYLFELVVLGGE